MTTYSAITAPEIAQDAPVTQPLMQKIRDNPIAITEGAGGAPKIQDAALDTGAATSAGIAWVGLRTAGLAAGAVGSYAELTMNTPASALAGSTHAGSGLLYSNAAASTPSGSPSGTWRLMGRTTTGASPAVTSLFLRIS